MDKRECAKLEREKEREEDTGADWWQIIENSKCNEERNFLFLLNRSKDQSELFPN